MSQAPKEWYKEKQRPTKRSGEPLKETGAEHASQFNSQNISI